MRYDLSMELLSKGVSINRVEAQILGSMFSSSNKVKKSDFISAEDGTQICEVYLTNGIKFLVKFQLEKINDSSYSHMYVESNDFKTNNNESIKTFLYIKTPYSNDYAYYFEDFDFEIGVNTEDGYYVVSCISDKRVRPAEEGELKLSYYDKDAVEYYKFRCGKNEFLNPTIKELEYYGIVPDSVSSLAEEKYSIITSRPFGMLLGDLDNFLNNILNMTKNKKR